MTSQMRETRRRTPGVESGWYADAADVIRLLDEHGLHAPSKTDAARTIRRWRNGEHRTASLEAVDRLLVGRFGRPDLVRELDWQRPAGPDPDWQRAASKRSRTRRTSRGSNPTGGRFRAPQRRPLRAAAKQPAAARRPRSQLDPPPAASECEAGRGSNLQTSKRP